MNYHTDPRLIWLNRYVKHKENLRRLHDKLEELNHKIGVIRESGNCPTYLEELQANKNALEARIAKRKEYGRILKQEIEDMIDCLEDPRYISILEDNFIHGLSVTEIALKYNRTVRWIHILRKAAIEALPWDDTSKDV